MPDPADPANSDAPPSRRPSAPAEVWEAVRRDYLSGLTAPDCCRRHGVGLSTLRERAAREGWRRADQPWSPPNRLDPDDEGVQLEDHVGGDLDHVEFGQLCWIATRRMMRAVMRGDAGEAMRWRRVSQAMAEERDQLRRFIAQAEQIDRNRRAWAEAEGSGDPDDPDGPDGPDGVSGV